MVEQDRRVIESRVDVAEGSGNAFYPQSDYTLIILFSA